MVLFEIFQLFWPCCFQQDRSLQIINIIRFITFIIIVCTWLLFLNNVNELIFVFQIIPKCRFCSRFLAERHIVQLRCSPLFFSLLNPVFYIYRYYFGYPRAELPPLFFDYRYSSYIYIYMYSHIYIFYNVCIYIKIHTYIYMI